MGVLNSFFARGVGNSPIKKIARGDGQAWNLLIHNKNVRYRLSQLISEELAQSCNGRKVSS